MDVYGVIGWPIKHSLSPAMHNAAFKKLGIDAEYRPFEVRPEELEEYLLNRKDVVGFNITIPHKVKAKEIIHDTGRFVHGQADTRYIEFCGAINTVKREGERFRCTNTDVSGFMDSLREDLNFTPLDKNVLLVGCGGAGRAVVAGLICGDKKCKKIYVYDNNISITEATKRYFSGFSDLASKLEFISEKEISDRIKKCQLLVNASPLGMKEGDASPIAKNLLHEDLSIHDVVYNRETELLGDAKSLGLPAAGGLGMFLYQGASSFEFWTGKKAPIDVMRKALNKAIK